MLKQHSISKHQRLAILSPADNTNTKSEGRILPFAFLMVFKKVIL
jgi:hypothetical protein